MMAVLPRAAPNRRRPGERGFTLLELLVAMTLLGLVMAALSGGLRFGVRAWERGNRQSVRILDMHGAQTALRRQLGQAQPLGLSDAASGGVTLAFVGQRRDVRFVAPVPAEVGGGLYSFFLHLEEDTAGSRLVLEHAPLPANADGPWSGDHETVTLLPDAASLNLSYFGSLANGEPPTWHETWKDAPVLPRLVRLAVMFGTTSPAWPELVIALDVNGPPVLSAMPSAKP